MMNNYPKNSFINFVHIPKCAGSTFRASLIDPYIPKELINGPIIGVRLLRKYQNDLQFLKGHFAYGSHRYFPKKSPIHQRECINIVSLREPLDQMISYYYYKIQVDEVGQVGPPVNPDSPHPILAFYRGRPTIRNMQTRMVAGVHWHSRISPLAKLGTHFPSLMLVRARQNLKREFDWLFFQDSADADFVEFAEFYGLKYQPTRYEKTVTKERPQCHDVSPEEKRALLQLNLADVLLYSQAKEWRGEFAHISR